MKRVGVTTASCFLLLFALLAFAVPFSARAETVSGTLYGTAADCKTGVQAKSTFLYPSGIAVDDSGNPKLQIIVDPDFNAKMKKERNTPDLPVTPIYDLVVQAIPSFSPCYTDTPEKFSVEPPKQLSFPVSIKLGGKTLVGPGTLALSERKSDDGRLLYEWKLKGWKNGIVSEGKLEKLIKAVAENDPSLKTVVDIKRKNGIPELVSAVPSFNLCAPVWGNGANQVVYDRVAHRLSDFIYQSDSIITEAFLKVDPFKAYQKEFAHSFNLRNYQGKSWFNIHLAARDGALTIAQDCGDYKANHISISPLVPPNDFASALTTGRYIQIASDVTKRILNQNDKNTAPFLFNISLPLIALHEFGHAFAGLSDEYLLYGPGIKGASNKNCSTKPTTEFVYNNLRYGDDDFEGCRYTDGSYRPSQKSIMKGAQSGETRFNVVSCGYVLAAIKGSQGTSGFLYWPECMNPQWNTIKPVGKTASVGMNIASIFQALSFIQNPISLTAEAGVALTVKSGTQVKVIVPESRTPPAGFVPLAKGEKTAKLELCLDATGKQTFADNPQPFRAQWDKELLCAQNVAWATWMKQQVADSDASFAAADALRDSISMTKKTLPTKLSPSQSITLVAVPIGGVIEKKLQEVKNIAMQCVAGSAVPVGTSVIDTGGQQFVPITVEQAKQMAELKKKAKALSENYAEVAQDVAKHGGKNTITTPIRTLALANSIKGLFKNMQQGFVLLSPEAVTKNHPSLKEQDMFTLSFAATPQTPCALPSLPGIMRTFGGLPEDTQFMTVTAAFDGNTITGLCMPTDSLGALSAGISAMDLARPSSMFGINPDLKQKLEDLRVSWYGCYPDDTAPAVSPSSPKIVRKSIIPPPAAADGSESAHGQEILIEHISADGTFTGEVLSVPAISYASLPLVDIAPDSEDAEEIMDLKANASDGPLSIELGDPVTLRWTLTSDAVICSANWMPDVIDAKNKAGVSVVSPRFPSTLYTLTCADKDGKPIGTDSVEIRTEDYTGQKPVQPTLPSVLGSDGKPLPVKKGVESAVASQYCPDQSKIFKGSIYHTEDGKPWIEVVVDPEFEQKEMMSRNVPSPLSPTPIYDLIVRIKPEFNYYCIKDWVGRNGKPGRDIVEADLPKTVPIQGFITIGEGEKTERIVGPGKFGKTDTQDTEKRFIYEWKIKGWKKGIASGSNLEKLVAFIGTGASPGVSLVIIGKNGEKAEETGEAPLSLCAPIWGGGEHKLISMYAPRSGITVSQRVDHFDKIRTKGFATIAPIGQNQASFSYFVELGHKTDDSGFGFDPTSAIFNTRTNPNPLGKRLPYTPTIHNKALSTILGASSCGNEGVVFLTVSSDYKNGIATVSSSSGLPRGAIIGASQPPETYVHEWGHAFAGLNDEYEYEPGADSDFPIAFTNCSLVPTSDYVFGNTLFGTTDKKGCSYFFVDFRAKQKEYYYRPSHSSLMGGPVKVSERPKQFNVVSCGWVLAAIKGGDAKSYFPECAKMKGVIKDGVGQSASVWNGFSTLLSVFGAATDSLAAVNAPDLSSIHSGAKVKVIVSDNAPPAEFQPVATGEKVAEPQICLDGTGQDLFKSDSAFKKKQLADWTGQAKCAQGVATATTLQQKIDDLKASIATTDALISSLFVSKQEMSSVTSLRGDAIYTIPAGEEQEKFYTQVSGVAQKCVLGAAVPLGTNDAVKGSLFASQTAEKIAQMLASVRQKNKDANAAYLDALAKGGAAMTDAVRQIPTAQVSGLQEALGATFMSVAKGVLSKQYGPIESANTFISVSMSVTVGANGAKKPCDTPYFLGGAVGAWFEGNITIDGLSYPNACIPEANVIKKTKEGFDTNIAFFQKLQIKYQKSLQTLEQQLAALKTVKYNCTNSGITAPIVSSGTIVRKSLIPQSPPSVNGADTSSEPSGETDTFASSPSYLIVESFDPADPWGEIVQVVRDNQTPFIGSGNVGAPGQLQEPGLYSDKLAKLKMSIADAIEVYKQKQATFRKDKKGGEALQGDPKIDGPLYLLQKMSKNLETNADGTLKDPNGFLKFFHSLKSLEKYDDPALSGVFQSAKDLATFSYLSPPKSGKPLLVMVPGAGGEPLYGSADTLKEKSKDFNILLYTYDSNVPVDEAALKFKNEFSKHNLDKEEHLLVSYSLGNSVLFSAVNSTVPDGANGLFSNTHVLSLAFPAGGSATQQRLPLPVQSVTKVVMPDYYEIIKTFNPRNPDHAARAAYLPDVRQAVAGKDIFFIEAKGDIHINLGSTVKDYAPGRDTTLGSMGTIGGNIIFVDTPPGNKHAQIWNTPEVKDKIDSYLGLLIPPKPRSSAPQLFSIKSPKWLLTRLSALAATAASVVEKNEPRLFDVVSLLLPGPVQSECSLLSEVLSDSMMVPGTDYQATVGAVKEYLSQTKLTCSFDEIEKTARVTLKTDGFATATPPMEDVCVAPNTAPKIIAVGGIGSLATHPFFAWVQGLGAVVGEIPLAGVSVEQASALLTSKINEQLTAGNRVVVVAHSLGSVIAFNLSATFKDKPVEFIYIDPPNYVGPAFLGARLIAPLVNSSAKAIVTAEKNGITSDGGIVNWTKGKSTDPFHDPWSSLDSKSVSKLKRTEILELESNLESLKKKILGKIVCAPAPAPSSFTPTAVETDSYQGHAAESAQVGKIPDGEKIGVSCFGKVQEKTADGQYVLWQAGAIGSNKGYTFTWSGTDALSGNGPTVRKVYAVGGWKRIRVEIVSGPKEASCDATVFVPDDSPALSTVELESNDVYVIEVDSAETDTRMEYFSSYFYEKYKRDDWDFLAFYSQFAPTSDSGNLYHINVKNDVKGIGLQLFDSTKRYGSEGRLRGIGILKNPDMYSGFSYDALLEEVFAHTMGVFVDNGSSALPVRNLLNPAHWSNCMSFPKEKNGHYDYWNAYTWQNNGDGTWTRTKGYSLESTRLDPFMLYLSGFLSPERVPDATLLKPLSGDTTECNRLSTIRATAHSISINDIIALHGPRVPSSKDSPKKFRTAFVLVVLKGSTPSSEMLKQLATWSKSWPAVLAQAVDTSAFKVSLKANNSNGPLSVLSGDKVTLSWTNLPSAAVNCTGNWQRDFINAKNNSGTSVVSPTAPSTVYTLVCFDVAGKPVGTPDSVEVRTEAYTGQAQKQPDLPPRATVGPDGKPLPVRKSTDTAGDTLSVSTPVFSGPSAGAGKFFAGPVSIASAIVNESTATLQTFSSVFHYSSDGEVWHDLIRFDIPELNAGGSATPKYSWTGNQGVWFFRACAKDICSASLRVEILPRSGTESTPVVSSGKARLISTKPIISGTSAGLGKVRAGTINFKAKVTNVGDGASRAFKALLQYSKDDDYWSDWVHIDLSPLGPSNTSDITYSWTGGEGVWFVRACDDISDECSASTKFEVIPI